MATRYTLSLPTEIYDELKKVSKNTDSSIKDTVSKCLKIGLLALKVDENPNSDILIREKSIAGEDEYKETRLIIV